MVKTDCFAATERGCAVLRREDCDGCSFYKKKGTECDTCSYKGTQICSSRCPLKETKEW